MKHLSTRFAVLCAVLVLGSVIAISTHSQTAFAQETGSNWTGYYWDNQDFTGSPKVTRTDPVINFNWQQGSPDPAIPADHFSVRWVNTINFGNGGAYRFRAGADDGIRVAIDGVLIINMWRDATNGFQTTTADVNLTGGNHQIIVDYYEKDGFAGVLFDWQVLNGSSTGPTLTPGPTATTGPSNVIPTVGGKIIRAVIIVDIANVRSEANSGSQPIAEVYRNKQFPVLANNGANTWFLILLPDGRAGWIFRRTIYLYGGDWTKLPVSQTTIPQLPQVIDVRGVAKTMVLVRSAPSARNSDKLGAINEGVGFQVLKLSRNRAWVFVNADGLQGWVFITNVKIVFGNLGRLPITNN